MFVERLIALMGDTKIYGVIGINLICISTIVMGGSIGFILIILLDGVWMYQNRKLISEFIRGN